MNLRFDHWKPAASGIFAVLVHGLTDQPLPGVANLGIRPSLDPNDVNGGRVLLETHCLDWPPHLGGDGGYGKIIRVELLHKLHDELKYDSLDALTQGIAQDCADARAFFAAQRSGNVSPPHKPSARPRATEFDAGHRLPPICTGPSGFPPPEFPSPGPALGFALKRERFLMSEPHSPKKPRTPPKAPTAPR